MKETVGLIVTDSSPLITLAAADSLHLLTMPGLPVMIPDMVYHETTKYIAKLGASVIVDWVRKARPLVTIEPTDVFAEYLTLVEIDPKTKTTHRGERSASEVLGDVIASDDGLSAILLFEDSDVNRRKFISTLPERVMPLSTGRVPACPRGIGTDPVRGHHPRPGHGQGPRRDETEGGRPVERGRSGTSANRPEDRRRQGAMTEKLEDIREYGRPEFFPSLVRDQAKSTLFWRTRIRVPALQINLKR